MTDKAARRHSISLRRPEASSRDVTRRGCSTPRVLGLDELPGGFREMSEPPSRAYLWGTLPPPPWVSIVGTRSPTRVAALEAFTLARMLARAGVTVVSGGALGIDSAAHLGAVSVGAPTLVVAPTWFDVAYPKKNRHLFEAIVRRGGGYLTLSKSGTLPLAHVFFHRNEALMALSHAVVLGQCPHRSGAKNAMLHARHLQRPRFALPFAFDEAKGRGSWDEVVRHGAEILVDERPVLRMLEEYGPFENAKWWHYLCGQRADFDSSEGIPRRARRKSKAGSRRKKTARPKVKAPRPAARDLPPQQLAVLDAVRRGKQTADQICADTGLSPQAVQHEILLLLLDGRLTEDGGGLLRYHSRPDD